jgi:signal transduction histidine kinase
LIFFNGEVTLIPKGILMKVLMAITDINTQSLLSGYLAKNDYEWVVASDQEIALEYLTSSAAPELVIIDIDFDDGFGLKLTETIHKRLSHLRCIIIQISQPCSFEVMSQAFNKGANDFVVLPISENDLMCRVLNAKNLLGAKIRIIEQNLQLCAAAESTELGLLAQGMAHDIRNPLTIALGNVDKLKKNNVGNKPQEQSLILNKLENSLLRIGEMVQPLLTTSIHERRDLEEISIKSILEFAVDICEGHLDKYNVCVEFELNDGGYLIACFKDDIVQTIVNLLNNSIYEISAQEDRWVKFKSWVQSDQLFLQIIDSGRGIPSELVPKLFKRSFTSKPVGEGTGLGLNLVKKNVERIKGSIEYVLEKGHTSFLLSLPCSELNRLDDVEINRKLKMLILDDEAELLELMVEKFSERGFEVIGTQCPVEAKSLIVSRKFDVFLLDFCMPKVNGAEMLVSIWRDIQAFKVLKYLITAYSNPKLAEILKPYGLKSMFSKPIEFDLIKETIIKDLKPREKRIHDS